MSGGKSKELRIGHFTHTGKEVFTWELYVLKHWVGGE